MRQTLMLATMTLLTACGVSGNTPWDQNHDGLIAACEGLNPQACDATGGCERVPFACTMECRDDGHGGCVPCDSMDFCRPSQPSTPDCSQLPLALCGIVPACEVVQHTVCSGSSATDFAPSEVPTEPAPPRCGNDGCQTITSCVNRLPAQCEALSVDQCLAHPGCALEGSESRAGAPALCDVACDANGVCSGCAVPQERCVTLPPPGLCDTRDATTCTLDGRCQLEPGPVCVCEPGGACPPCALPSPRCVPVPPTDVCAGRDLSVCSSDGRCTLEAWACPAICQDDGRGGCLPCDVPAPACVPVAPRCDGLDRLSCEATSGCTVMQLGLACTTECRDDGQGGCLPCQDFVCAESGATPPPQP